MAGAVRAGAGGEIADDVLREVLARLIPAGGIQGLLRCAATCKRWRRVATDRAFLRRIGLWPDNARRPSVLLGAFFQTSYRPAAAAADYDFDDPPERSPRHDNPPRFRSLQPGGADLAFGSFVPNSDGRFDLARPLASRRGLLLVRLLPVGDCCVRVLQKLHLAVCRPQIGKKNHQGSQHLLLPQPPFYLTEHLDGALAGCALLTVDDYGAAADDDNLVDRQPTFKVLVLYIDLDELVCACAYSSATGNWSAPVSCCRATKFIRCGPRAGVVAGGGIVHWVCRNERSFYTLDVDISAAATTNVSFTEIPIKVHAGGMSRQPPPLPCVVKGGRLSLVTMQPRGGALELWTKREHDNDDDDHRCEWGWVHSELIDLGSDRIYIVFFAESRGALLVEQGGAFSAIDLESKEKWRIDMKDEEMGHDKGTRRFPAAHCSSSCCKAYHCGWNCDYNPPVLYEADWVFRFHVDDEPTVVAAMPLHGESGARGQEDGQRKKLLASTSTPSCCRNESEDGARTILIGKIPISLVTRLELPLNFSTQG